MRNFAPGSEPPSGPAAGASPPPRLAPPPAAEHTPRHGGEPEPADPRRARDASGTGGQSVADLLARLQVQPSEGGRRRRREG
ncbi:hypothetical protein PICSAR209_03637 [Mycobacterium avium subsp. paratuberculosis]|nr:hypothetical protein PICSAR209_03637 [Mycobacterium avium subsp. paratuberculosis]